MASLHTDTFQAKGEQNMIKFTKEGKYGCFSNFYLSPLQFDGIAYTCAEAAFQAQKCANKNDRVYFSKLSPSDAKRRGRRIELRRDWEDVKYMAMVGILVCKFENKDLRDILLSTGEAELVENTTGWHDNIWGNCDCSKCTNIKGQNLLGKALMQVRDWYKMEH